MSTELPDPGILGGCVYYSQNREDLVLLAFFPELQDGFYVDVGGFDPDVDSVTKLFYLKGWRGVNVEPQPERWQLFEERRPRDINLNIGIASKEDTLTLRSYKSQGLATFSDSIKKAYEAAPDADTEEYQEHTVPVRPLKDALAEHDVPHIHFMKVDVEGLEYEVLRSNDWNKYRPEVLCIEANHIENDWRPILREANYELVFDDGLNEYYADAMTDRKKNFNYVKEVVNDRGGGIRFDHFDMMVKLHQYATEKAHHVDELVADREQLAQELEKIHQELSSYDSVKATALHLGQLLKRNASHRINRK